MRHGQLSDPTPARARRRGAASPHRCPDCGALWSVRTVHHPSGDVSICVECGRVERPEAPVRLRVV